MNGVKRIIGLAAGAFVVVGAALEAGAFTGTTAAATQEGSSVSHLGGCTLAGTWKQTAEGIGSSIWKIDDTGKAKEDGLGFATGTATLTGNRLRLDWKIADAWAGYYEWQLDSGCNSGEGELVFTKGRTGTHKTTVTRQAVAKQISAAPASDEAGNGLEVGTDRPFGDYNSFDLTEAHPELCRDACAKDAKCRAFVYVKPGVQGEKARCWLKSSVPDPVKNDCCVSGVKAASSAKQAALPAPTPTPALAKAAKGAVAPASPPAAPIDSGAGMSANTVNLPEHSPNKLDFGEVRNGQSVTRSFQLTPNASGIVVVEIPNPNPSLAFRVSMYRRFGGQPETVSYDDIRGNENYSPWTATVDPGDELQIFVTFEPNNALSVAGPGEKKATMKLRGPGPIGYWTLSVPLRALFGMKEPSNAIEGKGAFEVSLVRITVQSGNDDLREGSSFRAFLLLRDGTRAYSPYLNCVKYGLKEEIKCLGIPGKAERTYDWDTVANARIHPEDVDQFGLEFQSGSGPFLTGDNWDLLRLYVEMVVAGRTFVMYESEPTSPSFPLYRFKTKGEWMSGPLDLKNAKQK